MELLNGLCGLLRSAELDEGEASRATCCAVGGQVGVFDRTDRRKELSELLFCGFKVDVADEDLA